MPPEATPCVSQPIAIKKSRFTCTAKLKGMGVKTALELTLHACSPMDDATVHAIVDQTKDAIAKSMLEPAAEPALQGLLS
jgi:hypothetical protein